MLISGAKTNTTKENTQGLLGASKKVGLDVSAKREREREREREVCPYVHVSSPESRTSLR
jgi:hypothetical protein